MLPSLQSLCKTKLTGFSNGLSAKKNILLYVAPSKKWKKRDTNTDVDRWKTNTMKEQWIKSKIEIKYHARGNDTMHASSGLTW